MRSKRKLEEYWHNKKTYTPEQDWEKFKMIHTGKNGKHGTEHWIKQYGSVLEKYPNMRIYGWQQAIKNLFESGTCDGLNHYELYDDCWPQEENFKNEDDMLDYMDKMMYNFQDCPNKHIFRNSGWSPPFFPDLYYVSKELILCIEIEDTNKVSKEKKHDIGWWILNLDAIDGYVPNIYFLGFTRFGNFDWIIDSYTEVPPRKSHDEWLKILENKI